MTSAVRTSTRTGVPHGDVDLVCGHGLGARIAELPPPLMADDVDGEARRTPPAPRSLMTNMSDDEERRSSTIGRTSRRPRRRTRRSARRACRLRCRCRCPAVPALPGEQQQEHDQAHPHAGDAHHPPEEGSRCRAPDGSSGRARSAARRSPTTSRQPRPRARGIPWNTVCELAICSPRHATAPLCQPLIPPSRPSQTCLFPGLRGLLDWRDGLDARPDTARADRHSRSALCATRAHTRASGRPVPALRRASFAAGLLVVAFALVSPVDSIGEERLFSVHMAQHLLLGDLAPLLVALGLSRQLVRPVLAVSWLGWARALTPSARGPASVGREPAGVAHPLALRRRAASRRRARAGARVLLHGRAAALDDAPRVAPGPRWFQRGSRMAALGFVWATGGALANVFLWSDRAFYQPYVHAARTCGTVPLADQRAEERDAARDDVRRRGRVRPRGPRLSGRCRAPPGADEAREGARG